MAHPGRPDVVSAREVEVLAALGDHLTNAEIAARLFISIRTVESHVSSLLRKLQAVDRRALAGLAAIASQAKAGTALPSALTPFVGRTAERAALAAALRENRLVTAVGPGGIGKTRLALAVAGDVGERFADGVYFLDLVPVTDPAMVAGALAGALGLGERLGRSATETVTDWLSDRRCLVILDNCEHLLDGVVVLVEKLLAASPTLAVLTTSRARLLVPFERVFLVPGLSLHRTDDAPGDAAELFLGRIAAGGSQIAATSEVLVRITAVCAALDGMALAIELAAARYPSLGLDGLQAGLSDRLGLLAGGARVDDRHRSVRAALDWSHELLATADRALLRRISVFAAPFTASAASSVAVDWPPLPAGNAAAALARLADQSFLIALPGSDETRYRALEIVRQYGSDRLGEQDESQSAQARHLRWCLTAAADLDSSAWEQGDRWRAEFDDVIDELRAALPWAAIAPDHRAQGYRLALLMGHLCFVRGMPGEAQRRYETAAALAPDDRSAAAAWRHAAGAAESRNFGSDAVLLRHHAAEAALRAGDRSAAAADLAQEAERINRGPGLFSTRAPIERVPALIARGWSLAGDDPTAQARLLIAEAFNGDDTDSDAAERALAIAEHLDDALAQSAALDQLTSIRLVAGDVHAAAAATRRRTELLAPLPVSAITGFEFFDAWIMASECAIAIGDLAGARRFAQGLNDLPFYREEGHLATSRLLVVTVLVGDWDATRGLAEQFREGWDRAGRPRTGNLLRGAYAVLTMQALCGDQAAQARWRGIVDALQSPDPSPGVTMVNQFFDALLLLHQGFPERAVIALTSTPEQFHDWYGGVWRPWYAAVWAEAAVLARVKGAADHLRRARIATAGNPIATAMVDRAAALLDPAPDRRRDALLAAATALDTSGCRYQWARTLIMLGGDNAVVGRSAMADMGAAPMAWPRE